MAFPGAFLQRDSPPMATYLDTGSENYRRFGVFLLVLFFGVAVQFEKLSLPDRSSKPKSDLLLLMSKELLSSRRWRKSQ